MLTITLNLLDYLSNDLLVFQHYTTRTVDTSKGILISELDKQEQYVHVEFRDDCAVIWDIKFWKDSSTRLENTRKESDRRRRQYYLDEENIAIVAKAVAKKTGIKDWTLMKPLAVEIIKKEKFDSLPYLDLTQLKVKVD